MRLAPGACYDDCIGGSARPARFAHSVVGEEERGSVVVEEAATRGGAFKEFEASRRILLACRGCAERLVLLGREIDWREEGRSTFTCCGCGTVLTFADRVGTGRPGPSGSARGMGAGMGGRT